MTSGHIINHPRIKSDSSAIRRCLNRDESISRSDHRATIGTTLGGYTPTEGQRDFLHARIAVLQTATLPLGYPAGFVKIQTILGRSASVNARSWFVIGCNDLLVTPRF
jgi:hypothetical protein